MTAHDPNQNANQPADALAAAGAKLRASHKDETSQILRSELKTGGKYLRIEVPNFNGSPEDPVLRKKYAAAGLDNAEPKTSYLRLGAVPTELRNRIVAFIARSDAATAAGQTAPKPTEFMPSTGEDLALSVLAFADDNRMRCALGSESSKAGSGNAYSSNYRPPNSRYQRSSLLHTLGGWREHTDGNRISTTRGDKVEVIGGNSLLSVRCRDTSHNLESGWDVSGGHVSGSTNSRANRKRPLLIQTTKKKDSTEDEQDGLFWSKRSGGTWRSNEGATKGDSCEYRMGDSHDTLYGHEQISRTGKEAPTAWHEPEDCLNPDTCECNPKVIDTTFAEQISSHTGSETQRVPQLSDTTHVTSMTTATHAGSMESHQTHQSLQSHTQALTMTDTTRCDGEHSTTTKANAIIDSTTAGTTDSTTLSDTFEFTLGPCVSASMGNSDSIMLGGTTSITIGATAELTIAASCAITVGPSLAMKMALTQERNEGATADVKLIGKLDVDAVLSNSCALAMARKSLISMYGIP